MRHGRGSFTKWQLGGSQLTFECTLGTVQESFLSFERIGKMNSVQLQLMRHLACQQRQRYRPLHSRRQAGLQALHATERRPCPCLAPITAGLVYSFLQVSQVVVLSEVVPLHRPFDLLLTAWKGKRTVTVCSSFAAKPWDWRMAVVREI